MEEKIKLELTHQELEVVYRGLLEIPSKHSYAPLKSIEAQVKAQLKPSTENDEAIDKSSV